VSIDAAEALVTSGGLLFVAHINRTIKSFALPIVGAEYILRWLPRGTHQWDKFVTPNELEIAIEQSGLHLIGETGVIYNFFADRWQLSSDIDVNYMVAAEKPARPQRPGSGLFSPSLPLLPRPSAMPSSA